MLSDEQQLHPTSESAPWQDDLNFYKAALSKDIPSSKATLDYWNKHLFGVNITSKAIATPAFVPSSIFDPDGDAYERAIAEEQQLAYTEGTLISSTSVVPYDAPVATRDRRAMPSDGFLTDGELDYTIDNNDNEFSEIDFDVSGIFTEPPSSPLSQARSGFASSQSSPTSLHHDLPPADLIETQSIRVPAASTSTVPPADHRIAAFDAAIAKPPAPSQTTVATNKVPSARTSIPPIRHFAPPVRKPTIPVRKPVPSPATVNKPVPARTRIPPSTRNSPPAHNDDSVQSATHSNVPTQPVVPAPSVVSVRSIVSVPSVPSVPFVVPVPSVVPSVVPIPSVSGAGRATRTRTSTIQPVHYDETSSDDELNFTSPSKRKAKSQSVDLGGERGKKVRQRAKRVRL